MAFRASFSRSLLAAARTPRPAAAAPRLRPPPNAAPRLHHRRASRIPALGMAQSLLPLQTMVTGSSLTSHLSASARACVELSQGWTEKDG